MQYAILCYHSENVVCAWTKEEDDAVMCQAQVVHDRVAKAGKLGPVARLMPTTAATTLRKGQEPPLVIDGPFAETKEQLLGFYVVALPGARGGARDRAGTRPSQSRRSLRDTTDRDFPSGSRRRVTDLACINTALISARPRAVAALLRYFRNLETAEEAFQEACLRALKSWPQNGPPRDPAAWLIMVGRNAALDAVRHRSRQSALPAEEVVSDLGDAEAALAERLDDAHYRDDILRLLFICCHSDLPVTQQIALALRVVSGLSVKEIARAFLASESAMEQRITRAKRRVEDAAIAFETPGPVERSERLATVAAMIYLLFNEGYSASGGEAHVRAPLCDEAIRLSRLLLRLFQSEPEIMGLTALLLLQHARTPARLDANGAIVLLDDQDRSLWDRKMIAEGLALIDKAVRHKRPGPYQVQAAIAALHAQAARPGEYRLDAN